MGNKNSCSCFYGGQKSKDDVYRPATAVPRSEEVGVDNGSNGDTAYPIGGVVPHISDREILPEGEIVFLYAL